jgi:hypothetical protein
MNFEVCIFLLVNLGPKCYTSGNGTKTFEPFVKAVKVKRKGNCDFIKYTSCCTDIHHLMTDVGNSINIYPVLLNSLFNNDFSQFLLANLQVKIVCQFLTREPMQALGYCYSEWCMMSVKTLAWLLLPPK